MKAIDLEIDRLAMMCGVSLLQPGVVEAIFHDNQSLCLVRNHVAWNKLRGLLFLHYHVVGNVIEHDSAVLATKAVGESAAKVRERLQPRLS